MVVLLVTFVDAQGRRGGGGGGGGGGRGRGGRRGGGLRGSMSRQSAAVDNPVTATAPATQITAG